MINLSGQQARTPPSVGLSGEQVCFFFLFLMAEKVKTHVEG
jgi:hypothetical protein